MRLLALQLKRIGDLVLTAPAFALLKEAFPESHLTVAVHQSTAGLLPAIPSVDAGIVTGPGRGWSPFQQALTSFPDVVLDFTGSDRAALLAWLSRSPRRITYQQKSRPWLRRRAFHEEVISSVRDQHTVDHYLRLTAAVLPPGAAEPQVAALPSLAVPPEEQAPAAAQRAKAGLTGPYAVIQAGTARAEKYWLPERWAAVIQALHERGLQCVLTGGRDPEELAHLEAIQAALPARIPSLAGRQSLLALADTVAHAALVLSVDTAVVHLASAFQRPQVALFGPTNPFHWRPRHAQAVVLSAAQPEEPLTQWQPRLRGAPMEHLSTAAVIRATDALLLRPAPAR